MKDSLLTIIICLLAVSAYAQKSDPPPRKQTKGKGSVKRPNLCSQLYVGTSTGVNNNTGFGGLDFDIPIEKKVSVDIGAGYSTWGYKLHIGGKYYLQPCHRGWAFGTGITYNTGLNGYEHDKATVAGTERVRLNLHSISNVLFAVYHYWSLGRRYNRFFTELGWSVPLTTNNMFDEIYGDPLTSKSVKEIKQMSPGGPIAGVGISFSIY